jgi:hypothetical protein
VRSSNVTLRVVMTRLSSGIQILAGQLDRQLLPEKRVKRSLLRGATSRENLG